MFADQLLHQDLALGRREVGSRMQLAPSGQVILDYQLHSGWQEGMIHGLIESLGRGYGEP